MAKVPTSIPFSKKRKETFLEHLRRYGNKHHAAKMTGVFIRTVYDHEKKYPNFGDEVEDALGDFLGALESSAVEKAIEGKDRIVVSAGKVVRHDGKPLTEKVFSDGLHSQLLKANAPDKYRENRMVRHEGGGGVLMFSAPTEKEWQNRLDQMAKEQAEKFAAEEEEHKKG